MLLKLVFVTVLINCVLLRRIVAEVSIVTTCRISNNVDTRGECKLLKHCPQAIEAIRYNLTRPTHCGFLGQDPIVCCAKETTSTAPVSEPISIVSKRVQKCNEYSKSVYEERHSITLVPTNESPGNLKVDTCVINFIPLIVGGAQARSRVFPHYALLGYNATDTTNGDIEWKCGGSLVSSRFVLTAAHCLLLRDLGPVQIVRLGDFSDDRFLTEILVERSIRHPDFIATKLYNDIGLIKLVKRVQFSRYIRPICLPTSGELPTNKLIETGWEFYPIIETEKKQLLKEIVSVMTNEECNSYFEPIMSEKLRDGIIDKQMCTQNDRSVEFCKGDMLQTLNPDAYCMYTQIGVASFSASCVHVPSIYTRVFNYSDWIEDIIWGTDEDY